MLLALDYIKTFFKELLLPPSGLLLLALLGWCLMRRQLRLARVLLAVAIGLLWLLSMPLVSDRLVRWSERYGPLDMHSAAQAGAIVILGGGGQRDYAPEYGGPAAEPELLERLAYGAYLARRLQLPLLVTGFRIEATAMSASLERNFGTLPRWVDAAAYDTYDNAGDSARLLTAASIHRIVLVTSAPHMWRAMHEFSAAGLTAVPAPVGLMPPPHGAPTPMALIPNSEALLHSSAVIYEWLGERVRVLLDATRLRHRVPSAR